MLPQHLDVRPVAAALADSVDALVFCASATGDLLFANQAWRTRLGYSPDDLGSLRFVDVISLAHRARTLAALDQLFAGAGVGTVQTQFVERDGAVVDVEGSLSLVHTSRESVVALGIVVERRPSAPAPFRVPLGKPVVLTSRQQAVLQLFASGHTTKQVAAHLDIAVKTVHNHLTTIYRLLDAQSLVQATMIAAQLGLVELAAPLR